MPSHDLILSRWLTRLYFGNEVWAWIAAGVVFFTVWSGLSLLKALVCRRLRRVQDEYGSTFRSDLHTIFQAGGTWFLFILAVFAATRILDLGQRGERTLRAVVVIAVLVQAALLANVALRLATERWIADRRRRNPAAAPLAMFVGYFSRVALWTLVGLLALQNLGVEVTPLLTGLGIGGVAIALAVQNILGDLFASMSIVVDKPFVIGDFIIVGDMMGTVENIGLKTTRLRSLWGEQLVFPNHDLLQSRIRNYNKMDERRVEFQFPLPFDAPVERLAAVPDWVRDIVTSQTPVRFDRAHLKSFGASTLTFEVCYYLLSPDFNTYMDVQQRINLEILRRLTAEGIPPAYPAQTLHLHRMPEAPPKLDGRRDGHRPSREPASS